MTALIKVASWSGKARGHVIFVHGLGGHAYDTWRRGPDDDTFWPVWLARDIKGVTVWTLDYAAPFTNWMGNTLALQERAITVLERLTSEPELTDAPVAFVCHSLGGLVVKQMLREANDQSDHRAEAGGLVERVKAVVFIATPHTGSAHASWLDRLRFIVWPSTATRDLIRNDPNLRSLNVWYRNWPNQINHRIFYETQGTTVGSLVDPGSADAGLLGVIPVPIEDNHVGISKPASRDDLIYIGTRDFLAARVFNEAARSRRYTGFTLATLPRVSRLRRYSWAPIAARLVALIVVGVVGVKGVEALFFQPPSDPVLQIGRIQTIDFRTAEGPEADETRRANAPAYLTIPVLLQSKKEPARRAIVTDSTAKAYISDDVLAFKWRYFVTMHEERYGLWLGIDEDAHPLSLEPGGTLYREVLHEPSNAISWEDVVSRLTTSETPWMKVDLVLQVDDATETAVCWVDLEYWREEIIRFRDMTSQRLPGRVTMNCVAREQT